MTFGKAKQMGSERPVGNISTLIHHRLPGQGLRELWGTGHRPQGSCDRACSAGEPGKAAQVDKKLYIISSREDFSFCSLWIAVIGPQSWRGHGPAPSLPHIPARSQRPLSAALEGKHLAAT